MRNILGEINAILSGGRSSDNRNIDTNDIPTEFKVLMINGQVEVEKAYKVLKDRRYDFDLTSKRELQTDIKRVEKYITLIENGKMTKKTQKEMEHAMIRLDTAVKGLMQFFG